jgi:hypothetical protein
MADAMEKRLVKLVTFCCHSLVKILAFHFNSTRSLLPSKCQSSQSPLKVSAFSSLMSNSESPVVGTARSQVSEPERTPKEQSHHLTPPLP